MSEFIPPNAIAVHQPYGFVELVKSCADDLDVVNAARVSFDQESDWQDILNDPGSVIGKELKDADVGVLEYMMRHKHGTPFEHTFFKFRVSAPIFVFREWHRHRIGISINEESGRYVQLKRRFYLPDDEHCRKQVGKAGHYEYVTMEPDEAQALRESLEHSYNIAFDTYEELLAEGAAKEIARLSLPVATYSQMIWSCNARSLMAFLALRNAPSAQREIKDYAYVMEHVFFNKLMPVTYAAFNANGRVAP